METEEELKNEAKWHICHARRDWLRGSDRGVTHLLMNLPNQHALWAVLPKIWENMEKYDDQSTTTLAEMARNLGRNLAGDAWALARDDAERWIDEVWENRHDPDYVPPWEREYGES